MSRGAALGGLLLAMLLAGPAPAQAPPGSAPAGGAPGLQDIEAFERGFAVSLYQFDACGDALAGRLFRRALAERFAACPFTPVAREEFARRSRAEQAKARRLMNAMIEAQGGLPRQLAGMTETCHAQQASEPYRRLRAALEAYGAGALPAEAILPAACDAVDVLP